MKKQEDLISRVKNLANKHKITGHKKSISRDFANIEQDSRLLLEAYKKINEQVKSYKRVISSAEWLLDNFYMLEEQSKQIQHQLPDNLREYPVLESGIPRIYAIAEDIVDYTDGQLDEDILIEYLREYQSVTPLTSGELWIVPLMIKIALIKKIREIAVHIVELQKQKNEGNKWGSLLLENIDAPKEKLHQLIMEHDKINSYMSSSYAEAMLRVFRNSGSKGTSLVTWLDGKLALQGINIDDMVQLEHQTQAKYQVSIGNAITSLRFLQSVKWEDIFENLSFLEKILREDPSGFYAKMEFVSREYYRNELVKLANKYKVSELDVAKIAIECAKKTKDSSSDNIRKGHVGYYIVDEGRNELKAKLGDKNQRDGWLKDHPEAFYFGSIGLIILVTLGIALNYLYRIDTEQNPLILLLSGLILFIPVVTLAVGLIHWIIPRIISPCYLPKLELEDGIPEEYRTMVVIPTLLSSEDRVWELIEQMEVFYLANQGENIHFALLGDFKDSNKEKEPEDKAIINAATKAVNELNQRYQGNGECIFYFFHRNRQWNAAQKSWMGWERKRGALVEFTSLLRGDENTGFTTKIGDLSILPKIKFVITLDADTHLPRDAAKRLIGALAHPLNRPVVDKSLDRVVKGYGILQPRIGIAVDSASRSSFALTFSGQTGLDPYTTAVSDVYQDLFCEGIFTGKGAYEVDVFNDVLKDAIPENTILSHDLLEGSYIRAGLVTDIELIDGYPANYISYSMRLHRWVRGDWQLIPWLFSSVTNRKKDKVKNPLTAISKWKIFDNMRRSLLSPSLFLLLTLGLTVLPGSDWFWLGLFVVTLTMPLLMDVVGTFIGRMGAHNRSLVDILYGTKNLAMQIILTFVFLAHQAFLMTDAIVRTLIRVFFTRQNMLEWVTAADADRKFKGTLGDYWRKMLPAMIVSVAFFFWVVFIRKYVPFIPLAISITWLLSPLIAYRISQPKDRQIPELSKEQIEKLRMISRKTWKYFDEFIKGEDNWLPPDNYQEEPYVGLAHRTSPTNMGMALVSILSARDLGYISTSQVLHRFKKTFDTLEKLEKWKGHFFNWYDTRTLEPLRPRYVSSVDSGNLACYLVLIKQGIEELLSRPLIGQEMILGLKDTIKLDFEKNGNSIPSIISMLEANEEIALTEWKLTLNQLGSIGDYTDKQIDDFKKEIDELAPWVDLLLEPPRSIRGQNGLSEEVKKNFERLVDSLNKNFSIMRILDDYHDILDNLSKVISSIRQAKDSEKESRQITNWLRQLEIALGESHIAARKIAAICKKLTDRIDEIFNNMDFSVLYDEKKELFSIGYDIEAEKLQDVYYDLLASEARQTSFIAIAKGDIPQKHWFKLARSLTLVGDSRSLLSWGGTMFEYLMPLLIMKNYKNTLWDETYQTVVKGQRQYGDQRHVPWGVSESAFYAFDLQLNYQYKAFGVPKLGLKSGLIKDIVVSPYASIMALGIDPLATMKNIEHLIAEGMCGEYGMYESIDYTPERVPHRKKSMIVKTYMIHHQGMIFLALNNYLNKNIIQERFHSIPMIKATELLLQERIPQREIIIKDYKNESDVKDIETEKKAYQEIYSRNIINTAHTPIPEVCILSNNQYTTVITNSGGGFSQFQGLGINRWREDVTRDNWGIFFYIKNLNSNHYWSSTYQPCLDEGEKYEVIFEPDKAIFNRKDGNIETRTEVVVSPEHNVEIRKISLSNHSKHNRVLEVTSYFEPILAAQGDDIAHPAFVNLFVETEYIEHYNILLMTRRPRSKEQKRMWLAHTLVVEGDPIGIVQYETDRSKFIGRGRDISNPKAMDSDQPLSNTTGAVLDAIMSLRQRLSIDAGESAKLSYIVAVAETREEVINLAKEYQNTAVVSRAFELAWTHSQVEMRYLNLTSSELNLYQKMLSSIIYTSPGRRASLKSIKNHKAQSGLWTYGISGDLPIATIKVSTIDEIEMVKQMLSIHEYWRLKGIYVDLVILNEYGNSYEQPVQDRIREMLTISHLKDLQGKPGGIHLLAGNLMPEEDKNLLAYASRITIDGQRGSLASQIENPGAYEDLPGTKIYTEYDDLIEYETERESELLFFNDIGGFSLDGKEYVIKLTKDITTPMPWSNIVANKDFGFLVTESGAGYTWHENSRENKLTPWSNDPIVDPVGEAVYIRDENTGALWSITPSPIRTEGSYTIRHGQGYSVFEFNRNGLKQKQTMFVCPDKPVKYYHIQLSNNSNRRKNLSLTLYVHWVCGVNPIPNNQFIMTMEDREVNAIFAVNPYNEQFAEKVAFIASDRPYVGITGDRTEFIGRNGSISNPLALKREGLSNRVGAGFDPCGAIQVTVDIEPGKQEEVIFVLGQGNSAEEAREIIRKYANAEAARHVLEESKNIWEERLSAVKVKTPDESMNIMLNRWLLYQTLSSRLLARTGFYQAGGAYGFRDQLQDVLALIYSNSIMMKEQILLSSQHQFTQGDVQHWWHPPYRGIRTRITDDLLFLPYVTANYIEGTGDWGILDEKTHYLVDEPLSQDEDDRYNEPAISKEKDSIYDHCIRAIEKSLSFGEHGLPLMGGGDWNDGMDKVGIKGRGESVWLGWFLYTVLDKFIPICQHRNDKERAEKYKDVAEKLKDAIDKNGWDGGWYRRAYFDDGTPLGSELNEECRIDAISQSWAVISGAANPSRAKIAMEAMERHLVRRDEGLIQLLAPPFYSSSLEPGYIKGYVPGVRENGGQYTHGAVWTILANAMLGDGNKAWELYHMINPINHGRTWIEINRYKVEPYVMAADVYTVEPHVGRGGWTWYTGSAAWMYRVAVEWIIGLKLRGDKLYIDPCIPSHWEGFDMIYRHKNATYRIRIENPDRVNKGVKEIWLDDEKLDEKFISLSDREGEHSVRVILGTA
ncbi:MAG: glucoamylase family protein [Caldicoprobacterales bacterium]|jgi:cyclic beta-1,2-glucan synthetase|nr:glycosyl transferase [Clostridiales bacterium]